MTLAHEHFVPESKINDNELVEIALSTVNDDEFAMSKIVEDCAPGSTYPAIDALEWVKAFDADQKKRDEKEAAEDAALEDMPKKRSFGQMVLATTHIRRVIV